MLCEGWETCNECLNLREKREEGRKGEGGVSNNKEK